MVTLLFLVQSFKVRVLVNQQKIPLEKAGFFILLIYFIKCFFKVSCLFELLF
jgi:hypothetical protein